MKVFKVSWVLVALLLALALTWGTAFAERQRESAAFALHFQQPTDAFLGKAGVHVTNSNYDGVAVVTRIAANGNRRVDSLRFVRRWLEFEARSNSGQAFETLWGINNVYFNLIGGEQKAFEDGELSIYFYNTSRGRWEECPSFLVTTTDAPKGRIACVMPDFGLYGLALEKK